MSITTTSSTTSRTTGTTVDRDARRHRRLDSPIGVITVVAHESAVVAIDWHSTERQGSPAAPGEHPVLDAAVEQLRQYFDGERQEFDLPLDPDGTEFQRQAWTALSAIPFGETITYGEQASRLGDRNKSRAVGAANGRNPIPIVVPCHRVVGSNGHLTGFAGGLEAKAWLLDHELSVRASHG